MAKDDAETVVEVFVKAGILGLHTFAVALVGIGVAGITADWKSAVTGAGLAGLLAFTSYLAQYYGLAK